LTLYDLKADSS